MTKFLRAWAAAVGFASLTTPQSSAITSNSSSNFVAGSEHDSYSDEEEDPYAYDDEAERQEVATDLDMLPTLLVYKAGEIVHNWIRVDWEAEAWAKNGEKTIETNASSIEALLRG